MVRAVALIIAIFVAPRVGLCQTIARSDLEQFRCGLVLGPGEDERPVVSGRLEYWSIDWPETVRPPEKRANGTRVVEMVYIDRPAKAQQSLDGNILFVPLQPRGRSQFHPYVLSIWEVEGDSIKLSAVDSLARVGDPVSGLSLSEPRESATGAYLVFAESMLGDTDLKWGTLDVLRYRQDLKTLDRVYRANYSYCLTMRSDTLSANWLRRDGQDLFQMIRRATDAVQDSTIGWRTFTVSAETSYVDVEELAEYKYGRLTDH
jgi:hypothetical protein